MDDKYSDPKFLASQIESMMSTDPFKVFWKGAIEIPHQQAMGVVLSIGNTGKSGDRYNFESMALDMRYAQGALDAVNNIKSHLTEMLEQMKRGEMPEPLRFGFNSQESV